MPLRYRITLGVVFFAVLGVVDCLRHPDNPTRAKEYLFLFSCAGIAMAYGVVHDYLTWHISPEYFVWGKGIESAADSYSSEVVLLALKATWTAGLVVGAAFLVANNPRKGRPQLPYPTLYRQSLYPFLGSLSGRAAIISDSMLVRLCSSTLAERRPFEY